MSIRLEECMSVERSFSIRALFGGSIGDVQEMAWQEIREQIDTAQTAIIKLAPAAGVLALGALLLALALAQGLSDLMNTPSWVGYGIVGLVLSLMGYIMLAIARKRTTTGRSSRTKTAETAKENQTWSSDHPIFDKTPG
jgi:Na+/melibiose symporter-like transporter